MDFWTLTEAYFTDKSLYIPADKKRSVRELWLPCPALYKTDNRKLDLLWLRSLPSPLFFAHDSHITIQLRWDKSIQRLKVLFSAEEIVCKVCSLPSLCWRTSVWHLYHPPRGRRWWLYESKGGTDKVLFSKEKHWFLKFHQARQKQGECMD